MKCIIMVGGSGERLWPVSRALYPKSLLKLYGGNTLLQNTYETACKITPAKNVILITNIRQALDTKLQLQKMSKNQIILSEPMSKNTAPAVAAALTYIDSEDTVVLLPVDFYVKDQIKLLEAINKAKNIAASGYITALGVNPGGYPETGYGYILAGDKLKKGRKVIKFTEKPSLELAKEYIKNENYLWNCGIYVAKVSVLKDAFKKYANNIISSMTVDMFDENKVINYKNYENIESISIDYAVIEKADNIAVVNLETEWTDYGSWNAVYNHENKDSKGNVLHGNVVIDKVKDSLIYSSKELLAVSGITNTIVVETEDAVLVCNKEKTANVGKIVKELKKHNKNIVNIHKTVYRPWGYYTTLNGGKNWLTKIINVSPGHKLSLQSHNYRSEHWVVLEGSATVVLNDKTYTLQKRQSINIPIQAKHSLQNLTKDPLKILEVQKGAYISEEDIIRYEDMYGRVK